MIPAMPPLMIFGNRANCLAGWDPWASLTAGLDDIDVVAMLEDRSKGILPAEDKPLSAGSLAFIALLGMKTGLQSRPDAQSLGHQTLQDRL